jgi:hypothetical protein
MAAREVALSAKEAADVASVARALPDPTTLDPGTKVIVLGALKEAPSLASRLLSAFGRAKTDVPRVLRCTALVARGYVRVGAAEDANGRDLAFGHVPERASADDD